MIEQSNMAIEILLPILTLWCPSLSFLNNCIKTQLNVKFSHNKINEVLGGRINLLEL